MDYESVGLRAPNRPTLFLTELNTTIQLGGLLGFVVSRCSPCLAKQSKTAGASCSRPKVGDTEGSAWGNYGVKDLSIISSSNSHNNVSTKTRS